MRLLISIFFHLLVVSLVSAQDFTPPAITVTSHANGAIVNNRTITLSGVASDAGRGESGISSVYVQGTLPNTGAAGGGTVNWTKELFLSPGTNSLAVYALDNSPQKNERLVTILINSQPLDTLGPVTWTTSHLHQSRFCRRREYLPCQTESAGNVVVVGSFAYSLTWGGKPFRIQSPRMYLQRASALTEPSGGSKLRVAFSRIRGARWRWPPMEASSSLASSPMRPILERMISSMATTPPRCLSQNIM